MSLVERFKDAIKPDKIFIDVHNNNINEVEHSKSMLLRHPDMRIYVGSDSQNRRRTTTFATVIAYRYGMRGAHFIFCRKKLKPKIRSMEERLLTEMFETSEVVMWLLKNGVRVDTVEYDVNRDEFTSKKLKTGQVVDKLNESYKLLSQAEGWGYSLGIKCRTKPEVLVATKAADHLVRKGGMQKYQ